MRYFREDVFTKFEIQGRMYIFYLIKDIHLEYLAATPVISQTMRLFYGMTC